jgi:arylsulfatase A-like enzyme
MSSYGYKKPTTPHVDRLAARGLLFENAFATASWTLPSTASFLTGLLADEHGVTSKESCTLDLSFETLAEALQDRGFTTAAVSCNPLIAPERYFDQGFESFDSSPDMRPTSAVIDGVVATIERLADSRFFLYLHFIDPHTPHEPLPSELARLGGTLPADFPTLERNGKKGDGMDVYAGRLRKGETVDEEGRAHPARIVPESHARWIQDSYDACVGTSDHYCGVVLDTLTRLGLDDRTVIAFTSDHGEELFDHGLLDHSHTLHRELTNVPLILAGPGIPRGERVSWEVSNRFLATTLAAFGGARMRDVQGAVDLLGPPPAPAPIFYATERGWWKGRDKDADGRALKLYGGREGGYVVHFAPGLPGEPCALYEIATDPKEHADLSERPDSRERALGMVARFKQLLAEQKALKRVTGFGAGAGGIDAMMGLGYVGGRDDDPALDDPEKRKQ